MALIDKMTVAALTPPGYFNLADSAPATHKAFITWWNAILAERTAQIEALKALILTPWLVDHNDAPRTPWLDYLLTLYGFGFFHLPVRCLLKHADRIRYHFVLRVQSFVFRFERVEGYDVLYTVRYCY